MTQSKKFLLTGARSIATLDLARQLKDAGHTVYSADTIKWHFCNFSNAVKKNFVVPSPRLNTEAFIDSLVSIVEKEKIDCLIPTYEEILYTSQSLHKFPKSCQVFSSSFETLKNLHNKWFFYQKLLSYGLDAPHTELINDPSDLHKLSFAGPYALKASYSRSSQKMYKVESKNSIPQIEVKKGNPWIAQKWLTGKKFCTYSICQQGKVIAHATYPVIFAIDGNSCMNFKSIEHEGILNWIQKFVALENFTGQVGFDFFETPDGKLCAIECNPRSTNGLVLFNSEDRIDQAFLNTAAKPIYSKKGLHKQILVMMLYGWQTAYKEKRMGEFFKTLFSSPDVVLNLRDPFPFLMQPVCFVVYPYLAMKSNMNVTAWFTSDFDWDGE